MDLEEARQTLPSYLERLKGLRGRNGRCLVEGSGESGNEDGGGNSASGEGYYRPFKCSVCGHR